MRHVLDERDLQVRIEARYHAPIEYAQLTVGGSEEVSRVGVAVLFAEKGSNKTLLVSQNHQRGGAD